MWEAAFAAGKPIEPTLEEWDQVLPSLDVWLDASHDDLRYLHGMLPSQTGAEG